MNNNNNNNKEKIMYTKKQSKEYLLKLEKLISELDAVQDDPIFDTWWTKEERNKFIEFHNDIYNRIQVLKPKRKSKYKNIIFTKSKRGGYEANISDELFNKGYYLYKELKYTGSRQMWVLMKGHTNEVKVSSKLTNLDWWIERNINNKESA
jgi:Cys-tRNA synthase (O-phospho-L-seryl-tRNA:Cys-tRNA synthase)|tara:strand:- start:213 stop:665 length:453 start_codon:yes stop_codon:yes gene_type:complete